MDPAELDAAYEDMKERVGMLPAQPPHVMLKLYGLFKQASVGNVQGDRPGMLDVRGRAKWDAWASRKGVSQEDAKIEYVNFGEELGA
jgi:diazepam-binding inhibitor (GABA receptor modulator, acyl-CoA-binding protein)